MESKKNFLMLLEELEEKIYELEEERDNTIRGAEMDNLDFTRRRLELAEMKIRLARDKITSITSLIDIEKNKEKLNQ